MTSATQQKRLAPLSIRLTEKERKQLEKLAGDIPLSKFVKQQVFSEKPKVLRSEIVDRYEMLARILAALGEKDIFANLDFITKTIEAGDLELSGEQTEQIATTCVLVLEMRNDLIRALGLKPPPIVQDNS